MLLKKRVAVSLKTNNEEPLACEHVVNNTRGVKTVGVIEDNPITGLTKIAEPVGVISLV